jgi:hypothetical protein
MSALAIDVPKRFLGEGIKKRFLSEGIKTRALLLTPISIAQYRRPLADTADATA